MSLDLPCRRFRAVLDRKTDNFALVTLYYRERI